MPALLLGANIPDVDVASYAFGSVTALATRRGWTHGPVGLALLTLLLVAAIAVANRWRVSAARRAGREPPPPVDPRRLFLITLIGVVSHPVLDFLNNYGVRWLIPIDRAWYYGDAVFVADPWMWGMLLLGVGWSARSHRPGPARAALAATVLYIGAMGAASALARGAVARELAGAQRAATEIMVAPTPANPLKWKVVVEADDAYHLGRFDLVGRPRFALDGDVIAKNSALPASVAAAGTPDGRKFLTWSRYPYFLVDEPAGFVRIMDARYGQDWASVTVEIPAR